MPHPTPTAAPEAPPLPLRGEGMGVGARPHRNSRPGPATGPRHTHRATPTHEIPGHARDATPLSRRLRYGAALMTLLLATPATAQIIPTGTPAADILLSQAIAEQRLFHTCSALDPRIHGLVTKAWAQDAAAAAAILAEMNVPAEAIAAFTTAARPESLLPAPETPFEDVMQLCTSNSDWTTDLLSFRFTVLAQQLPKVFQ